jgi:hypothetical protein
MEFSHALLKPSAEQRSLAGQKPCPSYRVFTQLVTPDNKLFSASSNLVALIIFAENVADTNDRFYLFRAQSSE